MINLLNPVMYLSYIPKRFVVILVVFCTSFVQNVYSQNSAFIFAARSSEQYKDKIAALEKYKAPTKYKEASSQVWYDEFMTDRAKAMLSEFKNNEIIHDSLLLDKCNALLSRIKAANPTYNYEDVQLYINRSFIPNAVSWGDGTIMINLGLFLWIDNDDELAFVISHELAHRLLKHADSKIENTISILTSDNFQQSLKNLKKAEYGRLEQFRNLMKGMEFQTKQHSRYKESEADSLAQVFITKAGFNPQAAAKVLLKLDKVDQILTADKLYTLKDQLGSAPYTGNYFKVKPKYNGLSSVKVTMNENKLADSSKTHPDCDKRYVAVTKNNVLPSMSCCMVMTEQFKSIKDRAMLELVRYLYEEDLLGFCIHYSLFALQNNYDPVIYKRFLSLSFATIYLRDKNIERFNSVNCAADPQTTLKELQDLLFEMNSKDLEVMALYYLNNTPLDTGQDSEFAQMIFQTHVNGKDAETAYNAFNKKFPNNKYQYLLQKKAK